MTNINYSPDKINPYAGLFFCKNSIEKKKISYLIDKTLGKRVKQAKYSYSDILMSWIYCNFCGAERLEDVNLKMRGYFTLPSPDRIAGVFKQLASKPIIEGKHEFNIHEKLNSLMLDVAVKLKVIKTTTLDYDNTVIYAKKRDCAYTYKMDKGYQPGIAFLGKVPVYIEGRNGNSNAHWDMVNTLKRALDLLTEKGIRITKFRSDSAAHQYGVINLMEDRGIKFYIRLAKNQGFAKKVAKITNWVTYRGMEIGDIVYPTDRLRKDRLRKNYRMIATKTRENVRAIITNDTESTPEEILNFYNKRGAIEKNFDILKNDFNWSRLPFSKMSENTVFMIVEAIASIIFQYLIQTYSRKLEFVKRKFRLKNFIYHFIVVPGIFEGDQLTLFTDRVYD